MTVVVTNETSRTLSEFEFVKLRRSTIIESLFSDSFRKIRRVSL